MSEEKKKFDQIKYGNEYKKKHYKRYRMDVKFENKEVIEKMDSVEGKNAYLIRLVEEDIKREKEKKARTD